MEEKEWENVFTLYLVYLYFVCQINYSTGKKLKWECHWKNLKIFTFLLKSRKKCGNWFFISGFFCSKWSNNKSTNSQWWFTGIFESFWGLYNCKETNKMGLVLFVSFKIKLDPVKIYKLTDTQIYIQVYPCISSTSHQNYYTPLRSCKTVIKINILLMTPLSHPYSRPPAMFKCTSRFIIIFVPDFDISAKCLNCFR